MQRTPFEAQYGKISVHEPDSWMPLRRASDASRSEIIIMPGKLQADIRAISGSNRELAMSVEMPV